MDKYLMYLRKSRADRDYSDEDTLERHRTRLNALCRARELYVAEVLSEVSSADSIAGRPEMMRLLSLVESGQYAGVVCVDMDRLSRGSGADQALVINTFKYSGTKIITPQKDYDFSSETDEQFAELGLFLGRSEYRLIKRRLMQGRIDSAKEGKYAGGTAPYGYRTYKLQKQKGYSLEIVTEQAEVVRLIYDLYLRQNIGCRAIAAFLNTHGYRNQLGNLWSDGHVYKILNDPTYSGKIRYRDHVEDKVMRGGQVVTVERKNADAILADGLHEAIIPPAVFEAVQEAKKHRRTPHVRLEAKLQNPLCSLLTCDQCGKKLALRSPSRTGLRTVYCRTPGCPTCEAPIEQVEARVLEALGEWLAGYEIEDTYESRIPDLEAELAKLEEDLRAEDRRLDRIADLLEQGIYSPEEYLRRKDATAERIRSASERFNVLVGEIAREKEYEARKRDLAPQVANIVERYREIPDAKQKNVLLKAVVEKILYHKLTRGDFDLTVFPRLPR